MSTEYTPGPWSHVAYEGGWDGVAQVDSRTLICKLVENNPANAHLIAAAPELLAALKGLLTHCGIADAAPEDKDGEDHALESAARVAIRRAEGGAP